MTKETLEKAMEYEDEFLKVMKKLDYKGCRNCLYQIAPLMSCEFNDGHINLICPKWVKKNKKEKE